MSEPTPEQSTAGEPPAVPTEPTSAASWSIGGLYRLPSGNVARLSRPSLLALAAAGRIPNPLEDEILRFVALGGADETKLTEAQQMARYQEHARVFVRVAARALLEPKLILDRAPDPDHNEIGPLQLSDRDYTWIYYGFVEGSASDSALFRVD